MEWKNLLDVTKINDKKVDEYIGTKKYVATADIEYDKIINYTEVSYQEKPSRADNSVSEGDVIFAKMKDTVKVLEINSQIAKNYIFSTGFTVLKSSNFLIPKYLYFLLISDLFQNEKNKLSSGATQKAINNTNLRKIKIPVPPIEIQKQIVAVLQEAESLINHRKKQIELLDKLIDSLFYTLFGDSMKNDKGWECKRLKELTILITKGASPKWQGINYVDDKTQTLFVTSENVREGFLDFSKDKYVESKFNEKQKRSILKKGDFLINIVGASIGRAAQFNLDIEANINQAVSVVRLKPNLINETYLLTFLNSDNALIQYDQMKVSVARANLSLQNINDIKIPIPPLSLQNEFAEKVEVIEKHKELLNKSLELLKESYNSIMNRAFKGELFS